MIRKVGGPKQAYRTTYMQGVSYHRERARVRTPLHAVRGKPRLSERIAQIPLLLIAMIYAAVHKLKSLFPRHLKDKAHSERIPAKTRAVHAVHREDEPVTARGITLRNSRRKAFTVVSPSIAVRVGLASVVITVALLAALGIPAINVFLQTKSITVTDGAYPITISTTASTVGQLLDEYGIRLNDGDIVYPERMNALEKDMQIQIRRAMSVDIVADGVARELRIQAGTTRDAIAIAGISLSEEDIVEPPLTSKLTPGMTIDVTRVVTETITETERLHYREIVQEDKTLLVGTREVSQKGKEGEKELEIEIVYHDGEEISRNTVAERIVEAPIHRIVKEGTKTAAPKPTATPKATKASSTSAPNSESKAKGYQVTKYAVIHDGKRYEIKDTDRFMITAYTHTGRKTSTGTWPKVGTIAVDPKVIPYGTYLYIPGYGIGKAADTGVSGKQLDLFFDTYEECIQYGRQRNVKIYILEKPVKVED